MLMHSVRGLGRVFVTSGASVAALHSVYSSIAKKMAAGAAMFGSLCLKAHIVRRNKF